MTWSEDNFRNKDNRKIWMKSNENNTWKNEEQLLKNVKINTKKVNVIDKWCLLYLRIYGARTASMPTDLDHT